MLVRLEQMLRALSYKKNSCSTQQSIRFVVLINVKMPTIFDIFKFADIMINLYFSAF